MTHASVFSGIGGPEVAAEMLGWVNLFHCEINPFGRAVLNYWFPNSASYEDITTTDFTLWRGRVDVLTGGFPCQPFSYAGKRRGAKDDRYLWPFMHRCINQIKPTWVVCENVAGILTMVEQGKVTQMANEATLFDEGDSLQRYEFRGTFTLQRICEDLEADGYEVQPVLIPACSVGAPHRRDRVFIVGHRIAADTDQRSDGRNAGEYEGKGGAERIQEWDQVRVTDQPSEVRPAGATLPEDSLHCGQLHGQYEEQRDKRDEWDAGPRSGIRLRGEASRSADGYAPDTDGDRRDQVHQHVQPKQPDGAEFVRDGGEWNATNTDSQRREESLKSGRRENQEEEGAGLDHRTERPCTDGDSTNSKGQQGRQFKPGSSFYGSRQEMWAQLGGIGGQSTAGESGRHSGRRWRDFPTVSPIHRGNDGLPFPVDNLTISFSRWRTEALKAYGNAIVPQVMYEIFRAIELTEKQ